MMTSRAFEDESPLFLAFFLRRIMMFTIGRRGGELKGRVSRFRFCGGILGRTTQVSPEEDPNS